jgi:hypothetical protein
VAVGGWGWGGGGVGEWGWEVKACVLLQQEGCEVVLEGGKLEGGREEGSAKLQRGAGQQGESSEGMSQWQGQKDLLISSPSLSLNL